MLTPLRSGHNFKAATGSGKWEPISGTLGELGGALDVAASAAVDVVRSTPDPWSQARAYADAILTPRANDPLLHQWRGLLALFALSDFYSDRYRLDFVAVDLDASTTRFAQVMRRLVPRATIPLAADFADASWNHPMLVKVFPAGRNGGSGSVVGLLNPACLISGGRDLERLDLASVPWGQSGLGDPSTQAGRGALPPAALQVLSAYLLRLKGEVVRLCRSDGTEAEREQLAALLKQLDAYARDCDTAIARSNGGVRAYPLMPAEQFGSGLPALYAVLTAVQKVSEPQPGTSDCILNLRDDLVSELPFKAMILLDAALETPERPAGTIVVWGLHTLQNVLSSSDEALAVLKAAMAEHGYLLVRPDELFAPVLVQLDEPDRPARIDAHPESLRDFLLPVSPLALLLREPDKLRDSVAFTRDGRVTFDVLLNGRSHRLSRRYAERPSPGQGKLVREVDWGIGDVVLWPDFTSERWSNYCARIDYPTNSLGRIRGRFAVSGSLMARLLSSETTKAASLDGWGSATIAAGKGGTGSVDQVTEFASRKMVSPALTRFRANASGGRTSEIQVSTRPYEAVFYAIALDPDAPPLAAGCALLRIAPVSTSEQHSRSAHVAVDFGTTNTVACLDSLDPVLLRSRIVHPVGSARSSGQARSLEMVQKLRDFLPADDRLLPTPTVIIGRALDAEARDLLDADQALDDAILVRHLMYFQPDYAEDGTITAVPLREWSALLNSIRYDLKWSRSREMRDAARRYLRQLMMMIGAEWARGGGDPAKLRWHFSRPRDMGDDRDFVEQIGRALRDVVPDAAADAIRPLRYEGDAAAEYILDERTKGSGTKGALNVIFDIGGGTTDIAIWTGGAEPKQLLSVSLRIAGGDFFTDHIMANPEILSDFGLRTWTDVVRQLGKESDASLKDNIRYIGELLFSGSTLDAAIERSWSRVSGTDDVRGLKETAFLFLGGLAWFVGRHMRELIRTNEVDRAALQDVAVAFCGRGSGLFSRLHGADSRARTDISRILLLIAVAAGEAKPAWPQVQISPYPKIEVAAGMILMADREKSKAEGGAVSGNSASDVIFDLGEDGLSPLTNAETAPDGYTLPRLEVGIENLDPFLRAFAQVSGFGVAVSDHQRAKLVNGVIDLDRSDAQAGREPQSEFAAALKGLVGLMSKQRDDPARPATTWK
jgi:hypothetical protein